MTTAKFISLESVYSDILPTSVRQHTQPFFNDRLHIGEAAIAAAERPRLGLPALSRKICSTEVPSRINSPIAVRSRFFRMRRDSPAPVRPADVAHRLDLLIAAVFGRSFALRVAQPPASLTLMSRVFCASNHLQKPGVSQLTSAHPSASVRSASHWLVLENPGAAGG